MSAVGEAIMIPLVVIIMAIMDYAAWNVFVAVAGTYAILYMALLIILEIASLAKLVGG
jgi:hypothetical protein